MGTSTTSQFLTNKPWFNLGVKRLGGVVEEERRWQYRITQYEDNPEQNSSPKPTGKFNVVELIFDSLPLSSVDLWVKNRHKFYI